MHLYSKESKDLVGQRSVAIITICSTEIAKEDFKKIVDLEIVSSSKNNIEITSKSVSKG